MAPGNVRILCWEGYEAPTVLESFAAKHGVRAEAELLSSDFEAAEGIASGALRGFDVINLNNPFAREVLHPRGLIRALDPERFEPFFAQMLPQFTHLYDWARSADGAELLGVCQRFGPFSLVVNTDRISRENAEDQGFALAADPRNRQRYGVLDYPDFNIFHICIAAGLDPFIPQGGPALEVFETQARAWFEGAKLVTEDHVQLNRALVSGEIDFYLSGGVYTASPARLAGCSNVRVITPRRGPIGGKGGIVFTEVTSALVHPDASPHAEDFLEHILQPETALEVAFAERTGSAVAQMGDPRVMETFSKAQLDALQWDSLEEDVARSADYALAPSYVALRAARARALRAAGWGSDP